MSQAIFEMTLADYFHKRLQVFGAELNPSPHEDTLCYMGNMLARLGDSEQLFSYDQGEMGIRPLALLYKDAHATPNLRERCLILRQLGDLALFLGALFPQNFSRRGIGKDYFIGMGGGAYDYLSDNSQHNRHIFSELAETFIRMLELVTRVCAKDRLFDASDILNLYQRWRQNKNPQLATQLRALGIELPESDLSH